MNNIFNQCKQVRNWFFLNLAFKKWGSNKEDNSTNYWNVIIIGSSMCDTLRGGQFRPMLCSIDFKYYN